jgi:rhodanese-related sulfurtransferase
VKDAEFIHGVDKMTMLQPRELKAIEAYRLKQEIEQESVMLIDVREAVEYAGEHIPGATLVSLSSFDPAKISSTQNKKIVLYCRSGNRSIIAAQKLFDAGFEDISHLVRGISAWKEAGYPTHVNRDAPISLMRQVQIGAGSGVVIGTLLGALFSPWFLLLSSLMGVGLIFSGVTDTCILGRVLAKLPYNQRNCF